MNYDISYTSPWDTSYGNLALSTGTIAAPAAVSYYTNVGFGTLDLVGNDADIKINGESLMSTLQEIRNHLRIPNPVARDAESEAEWSELQAAGERYESLLKQYKEKQQVWETLKKDF